MHVCTCSHISKEIAAVRIDEVGLIAAYQVAFDPEHALDALTALQSQVDTVILDIPLWALERYRMHRAADEVLFVSTDRTRDLSPSKPSNAGATGAPQFPTAGGAEMEGLPGVARMVRGGVGVHLHPTHRVDGRLRPGLQRRQAAVGDRRRRAAGQAAPAADPAERQRLTSERQLLTAQVAEQDQIITTSNATIKEALPDLLTKPRDLLDAKQKEKLAEAQARAPYLQRPTEDSIVIAWQ